MATVQFSAPADDALAAIIVHRRREVGFMAARALRQRIVGQMYQLRDFLNSDGGRINRRMMTDAS